MAAAKAGFSQSDAIIHDAYREIIRLFPDLVDGTLEGFSRPFQACADGQSGSFPIIPSHNPDTTPFSRWGE